MNRYQKGSTQVVIVIVLIIALLGALGYVLWTKFASNTAEPTNFADCKAMAGSSMQESYPEVCRTKGGKSFTNPDQKVSASSDYVDYRVDKRAGTGKRVATAADVDTLQAGDKLKKFLKDGIANGVQGVGGTVESVTYTVDRVDGDYAVGTRVQGGSSSYDVWGPEDAAKGDVVIIASTQSIGVVLCGQINYESGVPEVLVDGKCSNDDGQLVEYTALKH